MTRNPQDEGRDDRLSNEAAASPVSDDAALKPVLRRGWTTGACSAAAAKAAYLALLTNRFPDPVVIKLPKGERPSFDLVKAVLERGQATAAVVKDAGDDPDVTHGSTIEVTVRKAEPGSGVIFIAGAGVGVVTLPGLPVPVGEPAINPGPRKLIRTMIADIARDHGDSGDVEVTISIPGGEAIAKETANGRLGIVGGLSILGTTGVVVPFSCAAWIASIHRGIDVARAAGFDHIAASTGSTSERAVKTLYELPDSALIEMGDFVGGTLKYLRRHPIEKLTLAGGFAKISKLAAGHLDLHSKRSSVDLGDLTNMLEGLGASGDLLDQAKEAAVASRILQLADKAGLPLAGQIAERARKVVLDQLDDKLAVELLIFDRSGELVGQAPGW